MSPPKAIHDLKSLFISEHLIQVLLTSVTISSASFLYGASLSLTAYVFMTLVIGQFSIDISNNYFDRHTDKISGQKYKVIANGGVSARLAIVTALLLFTLSVVLSLFIPNQAGYLHIIALIIAWGYNLGIKRTPFSIVCYVVSFALIPIFVITLDQRSTSVLTIIAFGLSGAVFHFIESIKDYAYDKKAHVKTFPSIFSLTAAKNILFILIALLISAILLIALT